jgi:hypothetical protein
LKFGADIGFHHNCVVTHPEERQAFTNLLQSLFEKIDYEQLARENGKEAVAREFYLPVSVTGVHRVYST